MEKVTPWPMVSDEFKNHAVSLVIGRFYGTPALIARWSLEDWLCYVAVVIETQVQKLVAGYGEQLPELPPTVEGPVLAEVLIRNWKSTPELRERFPSFVSYVDYVEVAIERGFPVDSIESKQSS